MPDIEGVPYEAAGTALDVATAQALAARHREAITAGVAAGTEAKALAQSVVAEVGTIRTAVAQSANSAFAAAGSAAQAEQTATDLVPRVEHIETMAGLAPGEVTDAQTANLISQPDSSTRDALNAAIDRGNGGRVVIANHPRFGTPYTRAALVKALDYAESLGLGTVLYCPAGVYEVDGGLPLTGYSVQIRGDGAAGSTADPRGTVFRASTQSGPVLDFTGWIKPHSFQGKVEHYGFNVVGSGVADPTKQNSGIRFASLSSCYIHDIAIRNTGGPGMEGVESQGDAVYLNNFARIVVDTPVGCKAHDVPYFIFNEANGNVFDSMAIRSRTTTSADDCGVSGAFVIKSNATYGSRKNVWNAPWVEYLHVPTGGTIFNVQASMQVFNDAIFWDVYKERDATDTSHFRFQSPAAQDYGANIVRGEIMGRGPNASVELDWGIIMAQSGNRVEGTKGYNGHNVRIEPGVKNTFISLGGSVSSSNRIGVVDNSGNLTNTIIDAPFGTYQYGRSDNITGGGYKVSVEGVHMASKPVTATLATNTSISYAGSRIHDYTLGASVGFTFILGAVAGSELTLIVRQDATGSRTVTFWPSNVKWHGGVMPMLSTAPGAVDVFKLYFDGTNWVEVSRSSV